MGDKVVTKMTVHGGGKEIVIPFADVKEIYAYEDLIQQDANSKICGAVRIEDRSSAIIIHHQESGCPEAWSCLVAADDALQEQIVTSTKILLLYSQRMHSQVNRQSQPQM